MAAENDSFITLHRRITQWEWYTDTNTKSLFIHLVLMAQHKDVKWRGIDLKRGQLLTGRMLLSRQTGLSEQEIRTSLNKLKSTSEITIKSTNKNSIITLNNYNTYQDRKEAKKPSNQPTNEPTSNQQSTTCNNVNNDNKEDKSKGTASAHNPGFSDDFMISVWPYFAKNKKGPYRNTSTQGVAVRTLFEMSAGNEEEAKQALRETLTNNYQGFTWYFNKTKATNGKQSGKNGTAMPCKLYTSQDIGGFNQPDWKDVQMVRLDGKSACRSANGGMLYARKVDVVAHGLTVAQPKISGQDWPD
jgi:hypothetical protein